MTAQNDLDRALGAWFGEEDRAAPPPEPLARVIESTRTIRPRPALTAGVGSHWVGAGSARGVQGGIGSLRPALVIALIALLALALAGGALLVGSRLVAPTTPSLTDVSIFVRRDEGPEPGVSVVAVRPDRSEVLVRKVPDSIVPAYGPLRGTLSEWGSVSASGWLALRSEVKPWSMVLIDLGDAQAEPWLIDEASTGGIGPRWGPTGLMAADAGSNGGRVVIADPKAHTTRIVEMPGGLVGAVRRSSGPPTGAGSPPRGTGRTRSSQSMAAILARASRTSSIRAVPSVPAWPGCASANRARTARAVTMAASNASSSMVRPPRSGNKEATIGRWPPASAAARTSTGSASITTQGRQVALVHLHDGRQDTVATVNRIADWTVRQHPDRGPRRVSARGLDLRRRRAGPGRGSRAAPWRPADLSTRAPSPASSTALPRQPSPTGEPGTPAADLAGRGRGLCPAVARRADRRRAEPEPGSHGARQGIARRRRRRRRSAARSRSTATSLVPARRISTALDRPA